MHVLTTKTPTRFFEKLQNFTLHESLRRHCNSFVKLIVQRKMIILYNTGEFWLRENPYSFQRGDDNELHSWFQPNLVHCVLGDIKITLPAVIHQTWHKVSFNENNHKQTSPIFKSFIFWKQTNSFQSINGRKHKLKLNFTFFELRAWSTTEFRRVPHWDFLEVLGI